MSLLDDLMDVGEPEPELSRGTSGRTRLAVRILLVAAAGTALIELFTRVVAGHAVSIPFAFFGLVTLQVLLAVLAWVRNLELPPTLRHQIESGERLARTSGRDGLALATERWNRQMAWYGLQGGDSDQFARTLQPRLARLVEERLRLRHGLTITGDRERAREVLGPQLWTLVTTPAKRSPSGRELAGLVKQMEKI
jgi:hypothetical protein